MLAGALGLVDVTNWGFVKLRQVLNSTVDPRYWEHLLQFRGAARKYIYRNLPVTQSYAGHEGHVPDNVH